MDLQGKAALVTGGARRLGRAFALALADAGVDVAVHHSSSPEADDVVTEIRRRGRQAVAVRADFTRAEEVESLVSRAAEALRPLDLLVNSAAIFEKGTLRETDAAQWDRHLSINLRAPFLLIRSFAQALGERAGKIVNVVDWRALRPGKSHAAYTVSKAGLVALTGIAARELAPRVQVNALAPGAVLPPVGADAGELERVLRRVPAGRSATLEEAADALLFLLRNDYVTGETLLLDGGAHLENGP